MASEPEYQYDVAFSFLDRDESVAREINERFAGRASTFFFPERQRDVVGAEGDATLSAVYESQARVVVVLYREGWGETPWTRIEATAIRNRAFARGWDFVLFIPLDEAPKVPPWLPRTYIWYSLPRYGVSGAEAVIDALLQRAGGTPREETAAERAARLARDIKTENERRAFLFSIQGVEAATKEVGSLFDLLARVSEGSSSPEAGFTFTAWEPGRTAEVAGPDFSLTIRWLHNTVNNVLNSRLQIRIWRGYLRFGNRLPLEDAKEVRTDEYSFERNSSGELGWRDSRGQFVPSARLAETAMKWLLDEIDQEHGNRKKR